MRRRDLRLAAAAAAMTSVLAAPAPVAAAPEMTKIGDFAAPTYVAAPPRDAQRVFVVEQAGTIRVVRDGVTLAEPFLDISAEVLSGGERGLFSVAFAPDYAASRRFYVYLTARQPRGELQVREYRASAADPDRAEPGARLVLSEPHGDFSNHNGGQLQFGPDGHLWIGMGDGGAANDPGDHAARLGDQLGKLLRVDPRETGSAPFAVPPDNPYAGPGDGAVDTIWANGLRNPWRFSFDRATGDLVIADVGQGEREEIDLAPAAAGRLRAANYGWRCWEGSIPTPTSGGALCDPAERPANPVFPVHELDHADGFCSITGGYVVRDPGLPSLAGRYLYGDFCQSRLRSLVLAAGGATDDRREEAALSVSQVSSFGEDACGRVYVASLDGPVFRVQDGAPSPCAFPPEPPRAPPAAAIPPDRTAPRLRVSVPRRQRALRRRGLVARVSCDERCRLVARGRIRGIASTRSTRATLEPERPVGIRLRLTRRATRSVRRALRRRGSLRARIELQATDAAGNLSRRARALRVRG